MGDDRYEHWFPGLLGKLLGNPRWAITLGQTAYYSVPKEEVSLSWRRHENCHKTQWARGRVKFVLRYVAEFVRNVFRYWNLNRAYLSISFEVQARLAESNPAYDKV